MYNLWITKINSKVIEVRRCTDYVKTDNDLLNINGER